MVPDDTDLSTQKLSLPQDDSLMEQDARRDAIAERSSEYVFDHSWQGYPPSIAQVPAKERPSKAVRKLIESGAKLTMSTLEKWWYVFEFWITHLGGSEPFEKYTYMLRKSPPDHDVGREGAWQDDAFFADQRLNGMYPWFIKKLDNLPDFVIRFPITNDMLTGVLPAGETLENLQTNGRLYIVEQPSLEDAPPSHGHVMTAPTSLFWVDDSDPGKLMPLGIQHYPQTSDTTPVITPNDPPNTWLAAKIHASSADSLVHSIYSHAVLMHFVMSNTWTAANQSLAPTHPIHAFLKPHFWSTLYVTEQVKNSMNTLSGVQCQVYGTGIDGQNHMVEKLYLDFDFKKYNPEVEFFDRGVLDDQKLPNFHHRDDALAIWAADYAYIEAMMNAFYTSDAKVGADYELQAWVSTMANIETGAGIKGLPLSPDGKLETRADLHLLLTTILYTVSSRHSSIENEALKFLYVPANPFIYRLDPPTTKTQDFDLQEVADALPPLDKVITAHALIQSADFKAEDFGLLGQYEDGFMAGSPPSVPVVIEAWKRKLREISARIEARNANLDIPYTGMNPRVAFNSIWN